MTEFEILTAIKNRNGSIDYTELLNLGLTGNAFDTFVNEDLIKKLICDDVLSGEMRAFGKITFGSKGLLRLQVLEQLRQKEADDAAKAAEEKRSQRRHDWAIAIFSTLGGALLSDPLWNLINRILNLIK